MKIVQKSPVFANTSLLERNISFADTAQAVGFSEQDGELAAGACPASAGWTLPAGKTPAAAFCLRTAEGEGHVLYCTDSGVWFKLPASATFVQSAICFSRIPACVAASAEENFLLLSDGEIVVVFSADGFAEHPEIPAFSCGAWQYERLWLALPGEAGEVRYSAPGSISDFTAGIGGGGSIAFPDPHGGIRALLPLGIYLYILRARGLQRLEARGSERDFILRDILSCGEVLRDSAAEVCGRLFWAEEAGVFCFGGTKAEKICPEFCARLPFGREREIRGAACGRRYALQIGGRLALFDADGAGAYIAACGVDGLTAMPGGALCVRGGDVCDAAAGTARLCEWVSRPYSAGGRALLRAVRVRARGVLTLEVKSESGSRRTKICGRGETRQAINLAGENFVFRIRTEDGARIVSCIAEYEKM